MRRKVTSELQVQEHLYLATSRIFMDPPFLSKLQCCICLPSIKNEKETKNKKFESRTRVLNYLLNHLYV